MISLLTDERPGDQLLAWDEIRRRGKGWVNRVAGGFSAMNSLYPLEVEKLVQIISDPELTHKL